MRKTQKDNLIKSDSKAMIDTVELKALLGSGTHTAVEIGTAAKAKVKVGRRIFWNVRKVQQYIDSISE